MPGMLTTCALDMPPRPDTTWADMARAMSMVTPPPSLEEHSYVAIDAGIPLSAAQAISLSTASGQRFVLPPPRDDGISHTGGVTEVTGVVEMPRMPVLSDGTTNVLCLQPAQAHGDSNARSFPGDMDNDQENAESLVLEVDLSTWTLLTLGSGSELFFAHSPFGHMQGQCLANFVHEDDFPVLLEKANKEGGRCDARIMYFAWHWSKGARTDDAEIPTDETNGAEAEEAEAEVQEHDAFMRQDVFGQIGLEEDLAGWDDTDHEISSAGTEVLEEETDAARPTHHVHKPIAADMQPPPPAERPSGRWIPVASYVRLELSVVPLAGVFWGWHGHD